MANEFMSTAVRPGMFFRLPPFALFNSGRV
jgi:hypothetical protein